MKNKSKQIGNWILPFESGIRLEERFDLKFEAKRYRINMRVHLYKYLRPILCVGTLYGIFPLPNFYKEQGPEEFTYCSILFFYDLFLMTAFYVSVVFAVIYVIVPSFDTLMEFGQMVNFVFTVLSTISSCICFVINLSSHHKLGEVYSQLKNLDNTLPTSENSLKKWFQYCGWGFVIYFFLTEILYIKYEFDLYNDQSLMHQIFWVMTVFNIMMTVAVPTFILLHGAGLALSTAMLYFNLNEKISKILSNSSEGSSKRNQVASVTDVRKTNEDEEFSQEEDLEYCRVLHLRVWSFCQTVSEYLSPQLIVVLTTEFLVICYNIYKGLLSLKDPQDENFTVIIFITALANLTVVGIISWAVDIQVKEHDRTSEILNKCRVTSARKGYLNSCILRFSLQILQARPVMNVIGFFSVNRAFQLSMIGTIGTYVVILLQFNDYTNNSCVVDTANITNMTGGG